MANRIAYAAGLLFLVVFTFANTVAQTKTKLKKVFLEFELPNDNWEKRDYSLADVPGKKTIAFGHKGIKAADGNTYRASMVIDVEKLPKEVDMLSYFTMIGLRNQNNIPKSFFCWDSGKINIESVLGGSFKFSYGKESEAVFQGQKADVIMIFGINNHYGFLITIESIESITPEVKKDIEAILKSFRLAKNKGSKKIVRKTNNSGSYLMFPGSDRGVLAE